jgi:nucleoside-diphosphate-sugar epimerase
VGTINLIDAAIKVKGLKNFVFASTMETYGWQPISDEVKQNGTPSEFQMFDENTPTNPNCPYAVAKLGCEHYLKYARRSYGLPYTIIRQTNAYGRHDNDYFVTEQIITQMLKNQDEINLGYSEPYRNFIFKDDIIDMWLSVIHNADRCEAKTFTIGPDQAIKIRDYADIIRKKLNWSGQINWNMKPPRPGEIYWLCSNHKLITATTGWQPTTSLSEGLDKTIEIWKENYAQ